jgi:hypothetical protein
MAIRAGQILHVANSFVVDRIQTGGPGSLNIPQEKIKELGNYQSVGIVRDVPDLSFNLDCLDVDTEIEGILTGNANPTSAADHTMYNLINAKPLDVVSPWKSPYGAFTIVKGCAIPQLTLESASYRYGLKENAAEQFSLKGDSIFYVPGNPVREVFTGNSILTTFTYAAGPALLYTEQGSSRYALNVSVDGVRQTAGIDYTSTDTVVEMTVAPTTGAKIAVVYGSTDAASYLQATHQGLSVKPAAIRGKDIKVYFSTEILGVPTEVQWPDVTSVNLDWKVTLEDDYEFGNPHAVYREATDVPDVTGSLGLRPRSLEYLFTRLAQITGVDEADVIGPAASVAGALRVELLNPESGGTTGVPAGTVLKTHYVPAARFTIPGYEGRVSQKVDMTLNFESDDGVLETSKGTRA